ncbi:acyl-CoA dehydrogenase [Penicillium argentinense]|uniref:Acyl-CoA dehydrogenase n=1 Tax=Penicillium argentinense TaxID=1131581 RepID=A0A9W9G2X0_9EURO|nr:acyl-CoA dehydrogenase [Penicillium argentinense]KAJ5111116.1 acyl-CoA dehydrogenase [Penicillium argentinense]
MAISPHASYSLEDVASHNQENSLWVIIDDKIFDLTSYLDDHPGGKKVLLSVGGQDATKKYHKYHRPAIMHKYGNDLCIGTLRRDSKPGKGLQKLFSSIFHR